MSSKGVTRLPGFASGDFPLDGPYRVQWHTYQHGESETAYWSTSLWTGSERIWERCGSSINLEWAVRRVIGKVAAMTGRRYQTVKRLMRDHEAMTTLARIGGPHA